MIPGRKFSHTMSASVARRLAIWIAAGFERSSVMLRLLLLMPRNEGPSPCADPSQRTGEERRMSSPAFGSTLMTSAPSKAN